MQNYMTTYYIDFLGRLARSASNFPSRVPRMVIRLRMPDKYLWVSGPDGGRDPRSDSILVTSSASLEASPYSFTHSSAGFAISEKKINKAN